MKKKLNWRIKIFGGKKFTKLKRAVSSDFEIEKNVSLWTFEVQYQFDFIKEFRSKSESDWI